MSWLPPAHPAPPTISCITDRMSGESCHPSPRLLATQGTPDEVFVRPLRLFAVSAKSAGDPCPRTVTPGLS